MNGLVNTVLNPTTLILEIGDEAGLIWAEDVLDGGYAVVHIVVFKRRQIKDLPALCRAAARWLFSITGIAYMAAWIPEHNAPAYKLMVKIGWNYDGFARGMLLYSGVRTGAHIFSISRDEALSGELTEDTDNGL